MPSSFKSIYIGILLAMSFTACNDDLVFNGGNTDNKMVIYGNAKLGSNVEVLINQSEVITEDTLDNPIEDVTVNLHVNGVFKESQVTNKFGRAYFQYKSQEDDSMAIECFHPDFPITSSVIQIPKSIGILQFDTTNRRLNTRGLRLSIFDRPDEMNFYQISMIGERWTYIFDRNTGMRIDSALTVEFMEMTSVNRLFFSDNNIVINRQNFELFNDQIFDGKNFVLDIDLSNYQLDKQPDKSEVHELRLYMKSINQDYYNFLTTLSVNRPVHGGPFSISTQVPSNINEGYGIFAGYSEDVATLKLK